MPSPPITASLIAEDPMRRTLLAVRGAGVSPVVAPVQGDLYRLHRPGAWDPARRARACGPAGRAARGPGPGQRRRAGRLGLVPVIHVIHGSSPAGYLARVQFISRSTDRPTTAPMVEVMSSRTMGGIAESTVRTISAWPPRASRHTCMPAMLIPSPPRI